MLNFDNVGGISSLELPDLIGAVLGLSEDELEEAECNCTYDDLLYDAFGIDIEQFEKLALAFVAVAPSVITGLTGTEVKGFLSRDVPNCLAFKIPVTELVTRGLIAAPEAPGDAKN